MKRGLAFLDQLCREYPNVRFRWNDNGGGFYAVWGSTFESPTVLYKTPEETALKYREFVVEGDVFEISLLHELGHIHTGAYELDAWNWAFARCEKYGVKIPWGFYEAMKRGHLLNRPWAWDYHLDIFGDMGCFLGFTLEYADKVLYERFGFLPFSAYSWYHYYGMGVFKNKWIE